MQQKPQPILELLDSRLNLLNSLAVELRACSQAMIGLDLDGMQFRVARQEQICREIRSLDASIDAVQKRWSREERHSSFPAAQEVLSRISSAQAEVRRLNAAHAALLRRSRRTLQAMKNFLNCYSATYDLKREACVSPASSELARA